MGWGGVGWGGVGGGGVGWGGVGDLTRQPDSAHARTTRNDFLVVSPPNLRYTTKKKSLSPWRRRRQAMGMPSNRERPVTGNRINGLLRNTNRSNEHTVRTHEHYEKLRNIMIFVFRSTPPTNVPGAESLQLGPRGAQDAPKAALVTSLCVKVVPRCTKMVPRHGP